MGTSIGWDILLLFQRGHAQAGRQKCDPSLALPKWTDTQEAAMQDGVLSCLVWGGSVTAPEKILSLEDGIFEYSYKKMINDKRAVPHLSHSARDTSHPWSFLGFF